MSNLKKKFTVDEEIVWKFEDFDSQGEQNVKCRIVEYLDVHKFLARN